MALTRGFLYVIIYVVINQKEDNDPAQKKFFKTFVLLQVSLVRPFPGCMFIKNLPGSPAVLEE